MKMNRKNPFLPETDENLLQQFKTDDKQAFEMLMERYYQSLFQYGSKLSIDRELVKDCLQDLFLDLWEKRQNLAQIDCVKAYLFMSVRNNLIRRIKKESILQDLPEGSFFSDENLSPEINYIFAETDNWQFQRLQASIESLPKRQRESLYLRYYENLSYDEIAQIMGLQRQAVANYIQYALQKLRNFWQQSTTILLLGVNFYL
jgi:RNA polymerase sigma factor (sigma-70 family)